jgi:predicted CoA-substrate-specific enzyme activase
MPYFLGIDIGSATSKGVIVRNGKLEAYQVVASGVNYRTTSEKLRETLIIKSGLSMDDITHTATSGHGADLIPFSHQHIPDLRCCAKGIQYYFPSVEMVIDVQSESSQVIQINDAGNVQNFAVSEVCASGSGSFIEAIANVLQVSMEDIGPLSLKSKNPVTFATGCAVFGESEAISRVAEGLPKEDILAGVHKALASRILQLMNSVGKRTTYAFCGGGALNVGLIKSVEEEGLELLIPPEPQIINALGAALIAGEECYDGGT